MKNHLSLSSGLFLTTFSIAQVGIGTDNPQATLDINGNVKIRNINEITVPTTNQAVLMIDNSLGGDMEIIQISPDNLLSSSSFTAYSARNAGGWSLLSLGIGGTNWHKINISGASDTRVGNPDLLEEGVFTAPESGIYLVDYEFQLASGVNLDVLGNKRLGLIKNANEIWEEKFFDAVRVELVIPLLAVPVTSSTITSLIELDAGETLTFAVETGGVNLTLLTNNEVNLSIIKL